MREMRKISNENLGAMRHGQRREPVASWGVVHQEKQGQPINVALCNQQREHPLFSATSKENNSITKRDSPKKNEHNGCGGTRKWTKSGLTAIIVRARRRKGGAKVQ